MTGRTSRPRDEGFYDSVEACRLTRVPPSTLQYWVRVGIVTPSRRVVDAQSRVVREGYSLEDLGYIRLLHHLRQQRDGRRVPTEDAVRFLRAMLDKLGPPGPAWAEARVFVEGNRVYLWEADEWETVEARAVGHGEAALQRVVDTWFGDAFLNLRDSADSILIPPDLMSHIEINPQVMDGAPVIRGTRIPTQTIRRMVKALPKSEVLASYPFLSPTQVDAALEHEQYLDRAA